MSDARKFKREADRYFEPIKTLNIGDEYLKYRCGVSTLSPKVKVVFIDYIRLRRKTDPAFNEACDKIDKMVDSSRNKISHSNEQVDSNS